MPDTPLPPEARCHIRTAEALAQRLRQQAATVRSADRSGRGEETAGNLEKEAVAVEYLAQRVAAEPVALEPVA